MNEPSDDGVSAADAVAPAKIMATGSCATRVMTWSARQSAPVQARDRVERGQNRVLLPGRNVGDVIAGQHDPPVDGAEIRVMLFRRRPRLPEPDDRRRHERARRADLWCRARHAELQYHQQGFQRGFCLLDPVTEPKDVTMLDHMSA